MLTNSPGLDFLVNRSKLRETAFDDAPNPSAHVLAEGAILFRIDAFGFSANNVTYATLDDSFGYFNFFPARQGFGRIPVWGFGDVVASRHPKVKEGARYYGYFPMSRYLVTEPARVKETDFFDGTPHRSLLPAIYNQYIQTNKDPAYNKATENEQMLLRPLFMTSFLLYNFFASNTFFGAKALVLSSASSKTAYGLAFLLHAGGEGRPEIVGLTSSANASFVKSLGCYDRVLSYDEITKLPQDRPTAYVDLAGNSSLRRSIHNHFSRALLYSCAVGATHWENRETTEELPGAKPTLFFAPTQARQLITEWGELSFRERFGSAWQAFLAKVSNREGGWMRVIRGNGKEDVLRVYLENLDGRARPNEGSVLSL